MDIRSGFSRGLSMDSNISTVSEEQGFTPWSRRTPVNMAPEARLLSSIHTILNKLSEAKYGKLSVEFSELGMNVFNDRGELVKEALIHDEASVTMAANAVFELAVKVGPPELISRLCLFIYGQWQPKNIVRDREPELEDDPQYIVVRDEEGEYVISKGDHFRNILLDRCEKKFTENRVEKLVEIDMSDSEDKEDEEAKFKKSVSNFMAFIAYLYNVDLVPPKVMADNIISLLEKTDEIELNSARQMLYICGQKLESYYSSKLATAKEKDRSKFEKMAIIKEECQRIAEMHCSTRQRMLYTEFLNYWQNGWKDIKKQLPPTSSTMKKGPVKKR